jgi:asparagine synthase (glutamine-hydrolysing)
MSGIMGLYYCDGRAVHRSTLESMLQVLQHRGSDTSGLWVDGSIGLGHRMLWTTPESMNENLPAVDESNAYVITADLRLDNREELYEILEICDRPISTLTDTDFVVAAYKRWGDSCPQYLLGDFAFAIYDRVRQKLFCARDHMGVKPFYYYHSPSLFAFASEIKGLFTVAEIPQAINEVRIGNFLNADLSDPAITTYEQIWRLPPAHALSISMTTGLKLWSYWAPDPHYQLELGSDEAYAAEFRRIFIEAVRCRLRSAFPIGAQLSGGLDSSSIVCTAYQILQASGFSERLHTFSSIFDQVPESDEREYIHIVLQDKEITAHFLQGDQQGLLSNSATLFQYLDEPILGNGAFLWESTRDAAKAGTRILLNGFDGDTTVSHGITRLTELADQGNWPHFLQEAVALADKVDDPELPPPVLIRLYAHPVLAKWVHQRQYLKLLQAIHQLAASLKTSQAKMVYQYLLRPCQSWIKASIKRLWQTRSLRKQTRHSSSVRSFNPFIQTSFADRLQARSATPSKAANAVWTERAAHYQCLVAGGRSVPLEIGDLISSAWEVEPRYPFMDKRLVEFCLALPAEQKLRQGWSRWILRAGMGNILPPQIQWRAKKTTPAAVVDYVFAKFDAAILEEFLQNPDPKVYQYLSMPAILSGYARLKHREYVHEQHHSRLWFAITLVLWLSYSSLPLCKGNNKTSV